MSQDELITLAYDVELRRPACVLLQAAYGCESYDLYRFFETEDWLLAPTPGMRRLTGTKEQWEKAARYSRLQRESQQTL